jgi:glutamyl-tRNA reductase
MRGKLFQCDLYLAKVSDIQKIYDNNASQRDSILEQRKAEVERLVLSFTDINNQIVQTRSSRKTDERNQKINQLEGTKYDLEQKLEKAVLKMEDSERRIFSSRKKIREITQALSK